MSGAPPGASFATRARVCAVTLEDGQPVIWSCDEAGKSLQNPRASTKYEAIQLVLRGVIRWGVFLRHDPKRFLRRLERAGARVVPVRMGLVRRYRFEGARRAA